MFLFKKACDFVYLSLSRIVYFILTLVYASGRQRTQQYNCYRCPEDCFQPKTFIYSLITVPKY